MARPSPAVFEQISREHLRRLDRLAERGSAARLKTLYERALADMERKARHLVRGQARDTFSAHHARMVMAQLRQGIRALTLRMTGDATTYVREASKEARGATLRNIRRLEEHYAGTTPVLPVEEAARFAGAILGPISLLRDPSGHTASPRLQSSMARYGARLIGRFEGELAQSMVTGETVGEAIDRIQDVGELEWWQAERIARTETAFAQNAASADAIADADRIIGEQDMHMRWSEHISDVTGQPFDHRVAEDSFRMHGQVARPGQQFVDYENGSQFEFPPMRPNDRAVLMPWRPGWGIPGWRLVNGTREDVT
jgi:hypothetical protein